MLIFAFIPAKQDLHNQIVTATITLGITNNPEIDILLIKNFELGIIPTLVNPATHPALLGASAHAAILVIFHVGIRNRILSSRL